MTRSDAHEAQYTRKLALAILSTLQQKGVLSAAEVDAILVAARRAAEDATRASTPPAAPAPDFSQAWAQRRPARPQPAEAPTSTRSASPVNDPAVPEAPRPAAPEVPREVKLAALAGAAGAAPASADDAPAPPLLDITL
ncbi:hypothetical protein [Deinococcus maricopensis]|nr:hypothetical protein [Deinococcus maricopensis]